MSARAVAAWLVLTWLAGALGAQPQSADAIAPDAQLEGHVVDARGAGVAGATVAVVRLDPAWRPVARPGSTLPVGTPLAIATTNADGAFRLDAADVPAGFHALAVTAPLAPALLRWRERIDFGSEHLPGDLELRTPELATVSGIVLDELARPAPSSPLLALSDGPDGAALVVGRSDALGRFALSVPAGAALTLVSLGPERFGVVRAPAVDRVGATLALHLARVFAFAGVLRSERAGEPLAGVRVFGLAPSWDLLGATTSEQELPPWGDAIVLTDVLTTADGAFTARAPRDGMVMASSSRVPAMQLASGTALAADAQPLRGIVVDVRDAPVAGADVRWSDIPGSTRTDASGRFELPPDVNAQVIVTTVDGARAAFPDPADGATLTVAAREPVTLEVMRPATAMDPASPCARATVRVTTETWDVLGATDDAGVVAMQLAGAREISARVDDLTASAKPSRGVVRLALQQEAEPPTPVAGALTTVRVRDEAGAALEGALVHALARETDDAGFIPPVAGSGSDGVARLLLAAPNAREILVTRPGHSAHVARGVVAGSTVQVTLQRGGSLAGVVRDPYGTPLPGAVVLIQQQLTRVVAHSEAFHTGVMTDTAGAFELMDLPVGSHAVSAFARGFTRSEPRLVELVSSRPKSVELVLGRGATLRGVVRDASGPIEGATVTAIQREDGGSGDVFGARMVHTREDGSFAIAGLQPDEWHDVTTSAEWHAIAHGGGRPSESVVELVLDAVGRIDGTLVGAIVADGARHAADVACVRAGALVEGQGATFRGQLDDDQGFHVDYLRPGAYTCTVRAGASSGVAEDIQVLAGSATTVTLRLERLPAFTVRVVSAAGGRPLEGARLINAARGSAITDASGLAELPLEEAIARDESSTDEGLEEIADKQRRVWVHADHHASVELEVPRELDSPLVVRLEPLRVVAGRVVDAEGRPAGGVEVDGAGADVVVTDASGRFVAEVHQYRQTLVARRVRDGVTETGEASLHSDAELPDELVVTLARVEQADVTVLVRDADGPLVGAEVVVSGSDWAAGVTDAQGMFTALNVQAGEQEVDVVDQSTGASVTREVVLEASKANEVTIVIEPGWSIEGRVTRRGQPVEGVDVQCSEAPRSAMTRRDGTFRVGPVPAEVESGQLMLRVPALRQHGWTVDVSRGSGPVSVDIATATVTGRAVSGGAAVVGASVTVECAGRTSYGESDEAGRFIVEDVSAAQSCHGSVRAAELAPGVFEVTTPGEGAVDVGDVSLDGPTVRGRVATPDGRRVAQVYLAVLAGVGGNVEFLAAAVAPNGTFTVRAPAGTHRFLAGSDDEQLGTILGTLEPGVTLDLRFPWGAALEITAQHADGRPASDPSATLVAWNGELGTDVVLLERAVMIKGWPGEWTGFPAGRATLEVSSRGSDATVDVVLTPGETQRANVTLP